MQAEKRGEPLGKEEEVRPRQNRLQVWSELKILERRLFALFISGNGDSFLYPVLYQSMERTLCVLFWNRGYELHLALERRLFALFSPGLGDCLLYSVLERRLLF